MIYTTYAKASGENNLEKIYTRTLEYFQGLGFALKENVKPVRLVFKRGSILFAELGILKDNFKTKKCELEINLEKEDDKIKIRCDYYIPWIIAWKSKDLEEVNKEVKDLESFLVHVQKEKICKVCQKKPMQKDAVYCAYCGNLLD
jgi:hypothetical protein